MVYLLVLSVTVVALIFMAQSYFALHRMKEGTAEMIELGGIIRQGAHTFISAEYKIILPVLVIVAAIFSIIIEKTSGITFALGATMSSIACILSMDTATYANVRTTNTARVTRSAGKTTQTAMRGGGVCGISVHTFGLVGVILLLIAQNGVRLGVHSAGFIPLFDCNPYKMRLTTYALGCSLVALFNRVAGGNYTKAADISADIVAKVRHDMPEDDSRMPNTIADFIGDIINDIAGNCSDLLESFVATIVACILIGMSVVDSNNLALLNATTVFPVLLAGAGLLSCIIGLSYVLLHKPSEDPSREINMATYISAGFTIVLGLFASRIIFGDSIELHESFRLGWISPWIASVFGIISGVIVGKVTEHYTEAGENPVKKLVQMTKEGVAFLITEGDALGSRSCLLPILTIVIAIIGSGLLCGIYGISAAALGMLSFVGTTVSIDAFGPISDNAGGIAESCHLDAGVRVITDGLDAWGNTTAAIGKGFAIGSAAFATVSLIFAYVSSYSSGEPDLNIASFMVFSGAILGGGIIEYFSAMLASNTIESAYLMAEEGDRQLSIPGVLEGTVKPDYDKCIRMAAEQALRKMLVPSVMMLIVPAIGGILCGPQFVGGILVGATIVAIPRAIFNGNSGGAFDNAKKAIESGALEGCGKGSYAHKAAVMGDTVGDTRKDVVGVALDIAIKLMSTTANTLAPVFVSYHVF